MFKDFLNSTYLIPGKMAFSYFVYYGIIYVAIITVLFLVSNKMKARGYNNKKVNQFIIGSYLVITFSAYIGTRFANMFYLPSYIWNKELFIYSIFGSGIHTYHSGLITGFLLMTLLIKIFNFNIAKTEDIIFLYIPIAHAIGRTACLLVGCCWGGVVSINIFGNSYTFLNPTPLYSIIYNLLLFLILNHIYNYNTKHFSDRLNGIIISAYLIFFAVGRFIQEFFRKEPIVYFNMTQAQIISLLSFLLGVVILLTITTNKILTDKRIANDK